MEFPSLSDYAHIKKSLSAPSCLKIMDGGPFFHIDNASGGFLSAIVLGTTKGERVRRRRRRRAGRRKEEPWRRKKKALFLYFKIDSAISFGYTQPIDFAGNKIY